MAIRNRFVNTTGRKLARELVETSRDVSGFFQEEELEGLPGPVKDYLDNVLEEGQEYYSGSELEQRGTFNLDGSWKPYRAEQAVTVRPPGFVWDARIRMFPLVDVNVVDRYDRSGGRLTASIARFKLSQAGPGSKMNSGELMRWLAEAVWVPTALLPGNGVSWEPVNEDSARAKIEDGENSASLKFHFNDENLVEAVSTESRYRQEDDSFEPWRGEFQNYEKREGMLVPMDGKVAWLEEGEKNFYWRGHVEKISYF